jgi:hypothetical protein
MAWLAVLLIVVAFGAMALTFGRSERAEERRILARAEAVLARGPVSYVVPQGGEDAAPRAPAGPEPAADGRVRSVA